jgi:hypothetical protein
MKGDDMKTNELTDVALDWAVAECQGHDFPAADAVSGIFNPSTNWAQGGPIIEREGISLDQYHDFPNWAASCPPESGFNRFGPTPLIAAMRCYVASKLGDNIDIPEELK